MLPAMLGRASLWTMVLLQFAASAYAVDCRRQESGGATHVVCRVDMRTEKLGLFHADARGKPYGSFAALRGALEKNGSRVTFAMNAGMFHPDQRPVGLLVVEGRELSPINRGNAWGNFYLQPNGVFLVDEQGPRVLPTMEYRHRKPMLATQSGPMLLHRGVIPDIAAFRASSTSRYIRNALCVPSAGEVAFVISEDPVTFREFARFFQDELGCDEALYLDGSVSSLLAPAIGREDSRKGLGPIFAVTVDPAPAATR
jgi:uncharacterized protein YigE (DUF2233 family)